MKNKLFATVIGTIFVVALVAMFWPAHETNAQGYYFPAGLTINSSNTAASTTTNVLSQHIDARGGKDLALSFTANLTAAGSSNVTVVLAKSLDGVNFEPDLLTLTWNGNGTNTVTSCTNFTINAIPFFRVSVANASLGHATNAILRYSIK